MSTGGLIVAVQPHSIAQELGWQPGDRLLALNGHPLRDIIDYRFYQADAAVVALIERGGQTLTYSIHKDPDEDLGVTFAQGLFDRLRTCNNNCPFCFLKGLPKGLRRSLYLKDDDYRYSFLFGNFITLTNLNEADWQRIAEQRLSPLYVSVHATDPEVRRFLLGNPSAPEIVPQIQRLGRLGIQVHAQVVLVPPYNTGHVLETTIADLAALYPTVRSIGIVPVGLTRYSPGLRPVTAAEAREVASRHRRWRQECRRRLGVGLVYLADEIFLRADLPIPGAAYYEGFPQLENGIGLVRRLLDDWSRTRRRLAAGQGVSGRRITLVCGSLIAPILAGIVAEWNSLSPAFCQVVSVENRFFGSSVTVSGLLVARDIIDALRQRPLGDEVVLPRAMFDAEGKVTLDDATLADIEAALERPVFLADTFGQILQRHVQALVRDPVKTR